MWNGTANVSLSRLQELVVDRPWGRGVGHKWATKQPTWKTLWKFLKKSNTELPYDVATPLLGYTLKIWKQGLRQLYTNVQSNTIHNNQKIENSNVYQQMNR